MIMASRVLATKADLDSGFASVKTEFHQALTSTKTEFQEALTSTKTELRTEFRTGLESIKTELRQEIAVVQVNLKEEIRRTEQRMSRFFEERFSKLFRLIDDFGGRLSDLDVISRDDDFLRRQSGGAKKLNLTKFEYEARPLSAVQNTAGSDRAWVINSRSNGSR